MSASVNRPTCRAAALVLAAVIAMQAFLAELAAQGVLIPTLGATDFAIICHGAGTADQGNGTVPEPAGSKHPCCMSCTAAAPALAGPPNVPRPLHWRSFQAAIPEPSTILIAWRAVRAGFSQAPPNPI